jgi:hypothetical protein
MKGLILAFGSICLTAALSSGAYADENMHHHKYENEESRTEWRQNHLDELHTKLNLNASQEPAWKIYLGKIQSEKRPEHKDWEELSKLTTPERLDKIITMQSERLKAMKMHAMAVKEFYGKLSADQKTIFDLSMPFHKKGHKGCKEDSRGHAHGEWKHHEENNDE